MLVLVHQQNLAIRSTIKRRAKKSRTETLNILIHISRKIVPFMIKHHFHDCTLAWSAFGYRLRSGSMPSPMPQQSAAPLQPSSHSLGRRLQEQNLVTAAPMATLCTVFTTRNASTRISMVAIYRIAIRIRW